MTADFLFHAATTTVLPAWLLLIFLPRWKWSAGLIVGSMIPALLSLLYAAVIVVHWGGSEGGFGSLAEVSALFDDPWLLLAGWVHYLAFDLFIGAWEVRDSQRMKIPHLLVVPCLLLTFVFGPIGLLMYLTLRGIRRRQIIIAEDGLATPTA
jgi:hypothetical protein